MSGFLTQKQFRNGEQVQSKINYMKDKATRQLFNEWDIGVDFP